MRYRQVERELVPGGPRGEVGVYPGGRQAREREALASAVGAGDLQHPVSLVSAEILDVSADDLGDPGAGEQQDSYQRRGPGALRTGCGIGCVNEREGLVRGEGRRGRGVRAGPGPGDVGGRTGGDVPAPRQPGVPA